MSSGGDTALVSLSRVVSDSIIDDSIATRESVATDDSGWCHQPPAALLRPRSVDELQLVVGVAKGLRVPLTARGGGTNRVGSAIAELNGWMVSLSDMPSRCEVDSANRVMHVSAGTTMERVWSTADDAGLLYAPDPGATAATIGGTIATNAAGPRAYCHGATRRHVREVSIVNGHGIELSVGQITAKASMGPSLRDVVVGSEGTLGFITHATLALLPQPEAVRVLWIDGARDAALQIAETLRGFAHGVRCIEFFDATTLNVFRQVTPELIPHASAAGLIVELAGFGSMVDALSERVGDACVGLGLRVVKTEGASVWNARKRMSYVMREQADNKLSEDVCVPLNALAALLDTIESLADDSVQVGGYGHLGDGNLHVNFLWNEGTRKADVEEKIARLMMRVTELGGVLSGEHGIGRAKRTYVNRSLAEAALLRQLQRSFDPAGILNPALK